MVFKSLNPNISFYFFSPSLATIANNSIICIALIAVIKQTQQTPTLRRASSQPHSQLGLYFVSREGDVALCRLKINYGLSGIFFPSKLIHYQFGE